MNCEGLNKLKQRLTGVRFKRAFFGYAPKEVDDLLEKTVQALDEFGAERAKLEQLVTAYRSQEENLRQALLRAEETARRTREEALQEAARLRAEAQAEADGMLTEVRRELARLEGEKVRYQEALQERVGTYEREAQVVLDRFYVVVRRHLALIEEEFTGEVKKLLERFERELRELPAPALTLEISPDDRNTQEAAVAVENAGERGPSPDEALLLGTVLREDLRDEAGRVVVATGEVLTPKVLERVIAQGLYGELIAKLAEQKAAEEKA
ncbi:MAG: DivIVA domain-containing protein [Bacillota bacterium]|nr:DivIVA domain-containing protein [Bacillota bacterium]